MTTKTLSNGLIAVYFRGQLVVVDKTTSAKALLTQLKNK